MRIEVAIAGVLDPKWPIDLDPAGGPRIAADRAILGPFDESALEIALRLRDLDPAANRIRLVVSGCAAGEKIARAIAALRVEDIEIVESPFGIACDVNRMADVLAEVLNADADVVLMGREFGDCDDGSVPALVAARLGLPFLGRVQDIRSENGRVFAMREAQDCEERVALVGPILFSVTNDRRNRLRKPLMKNVMAARTTEFRRRLAAVTDSAAVGRFALVANARQPVACTMVDGPPETIAAVFAAHIRAAAA